MFRGENATCNECLAHRENWAAPEMVKELSYGRSTRLNTERKYINQKKIWISKLRWIERCVGAT